MAQEYERLEELFGFRTTAYKPPPRFNAAPGQDMPVVIRNEAKELVPMRWGLVPSWAKDPKIGERMINARSETVAEKPSFRGPFRKQRCLVPADGWFEWKKPDGKGKKRPFLFTLKSEEPFGFAGLWDKWQMPPGDLLLTYSIITTDANELARNIHHRMPVVVRPDDMDVWLDCANSDLEALQTIMAPYPAGEMKATEVSTLVNSARNDTPDCLLPVHSLFDGDQA